MSDAQEFADLNALAAYVVEHDIRPWPCAVCSREAGGYCGFVRWLVDIALHAATGQSD